VLLATSASWLTVAAFVGNEGDGEADGVAVGVDVGVDVDDEPHPLASSTASATPASRSVRKHGLRMAAEG
jgi:hypothetical protein